MWKRMGIWEGGEELPWEWARRESGLAKIREEMAALEHGAPSGESEIKEQQGSTSNRLRISRRGRSKISIESGIETNLERQPVE
ncbi:MAG TPA: hypothetical protein VMX16_07245 [Terriglobia bacterium]|nr:hypothetical protein [Terriglobia bacterium]